MGRRPLGARGHAPPRRHKRVPHPDTLGSIHAHRRLRSHTDPAHETCASDSPGGAVMSQLCKVTINGESFSANRGDLLLDAALMHGIELPYECRAGQCGTCRVRVIDGHCLAGANETPGAVHACQARIISDLKIAVEKQPSITEVSGRVVDLIEVAPDVTEVCIESSRRVHYIPGQYLSVRFRGFPARYYSPTPLLVWPSNPDLIRFHVRRIAKGRVS